jgi:hypothetical protein
MKSEEEIKKQRDRYSEKNHWDYKYTLRGDWKFSLTNQ